LVNATRIVQTRSFKHTVKKLKPNQKQDLDRAVMFLVEHPFSGEQKKGDLAHIRVHKFKMAGQLTLLGYSFEQGELTLYLIALGSHENFYRDLKR